MASLESDVKDEHTENGIAEEFCFDEGKEALSSDDAASYIDDEEHRETMEGKNAEIAQYILEELQGLRVDMRNEIQSARDHIATLLNQPKVEEANHENVDIVSDKAPTASAKKVSELSTSTSIASTGYSNFYPNQLNFVSKTDDHMDLEPPPPSKEDLVSVEYDDDLDDATGSDVSLTPPISNTNIPSDSVLDFSFSKPNPNSDSNVGLEKTVDASETMAVDPTEPDICDAVVGSDSCDVETVSNTAFQHCKKTAYDFMTTASLNTNIRSQEQSSKHLEAHSLQYFNKDEKYLDNNQSAVVRTSTHENNFLGENILTTNNQKRSELKCGLTTTSMFAQEEKQNPFTNLPANGTKMNNNTVVLNKNKQHDLNPFLCTSAKNAMKNKIISRLKAKLHSYESVDAATLVKPVECKLSYTSPNLVDKSSTPSRDITNSLNKPKVEKAISVQTFESSCAESIESSSCENIAETPFVEQKSEIKFLQRSTTVHQEGSIRPKSKLYLPAQNKKNVKEKSTEFRCDVCERLFSYSWLLKDHMKLHSNKKRHKCQICKMSFASEKAQKRHVLSEHFDAKCFECIQCGKFYSTKEGLAHHKKSHQGLKPFTCTVCDESFVSDSLLQRHVSLEHKSVDTKPFHCDTCSKSFYSEAGLKRHSRIHTGEKPFPCKKCGRHFRSADNLDRHLMTHSDGKQHNCKLCKKTFGNSASLKRHLLVYHEEKKFQCKKCGKSFAHFHYLKFHMKNHADQAPRQKRRKNKKAKKRTTRKKRRYSR